MEEVISTIYFDGQFWVVLIEKIAEDGTLSVGNYTFGPEPAQGDLLRFYQDVYPYLPLRPSGERYRIKARRSPEEQQRCLKKSLVIAGALRSEVRRENRQDARERRRLREEELYRRKQQKKKQKKRGH